MRISRCRAVVPSCRHRGIAVRVLSWSQTPMPADGGDGNASVNLTDAELAALEAMKTRLASDPAVDPTTGAELGEAKA